MINPNSSNEMNIKFSFVDSELSKGKYRLVKKLIRKQLIQEKFQRRYIYMRNLK